MGTDPHEVDPQSVDEDGTTALMHAAADPGCGPAALEALLAQGADANASRPDGWTALHALSYDAGSTAADLARCVRLLADAGADLDAVTLWGWTPLSAAAMEGHLDLARALLAAGASPNARFSQRAFPSFTRGWTLAHFACVQPDGAALLALLVEHGVDLARRDDEGLTPLARFEHTLDHPEDDMGEDFLVGVRACRDLLVKHGAPRT